jgi:hypothetical protein
MPKKELAPQVGEVPRVKHGSRKRRIRQLIDLRWVFGGSTLIDARTHQHRYPIDEIGAVLRAVKREAKELGVEVQLSADERKVWIRMVTRLLVAALLLAGLLSLTIDNDHNGVPDVVEGVFHLKKGDRADWIEKVLGLPDGAVEKAFGLPPQEIEKSLASGDVGRKVLEAAYRQLRNNYQQPIIRNDQFINDVAGHEEKEAD